MKPGVVYIGTSAEPSGFVRQEADGAVRVSGIGTAYSAGSWICARPPGRCCATRKPTVRERALAKLLGPIKGFDLDDEPRCTHYEGHQKYPEHELHRDKTGRTWK